MKRAGKLRIATCLLAATASCGGGNTAFAAIWSYGCQGQLGDQFIVFNRDGLYVVDRKPPSGKSKKITEETVDAAITAVKQDHDAFTKFSIDLDDGLSPTVKFLTEEAGKPKRAVVFTEKSSRHVWHRHRTICWRQEDTDLYRKVYRIERDGVLAADITMQCFEYQLSTRGGHNDGCD